MIKVSSEWAGEYFNHRLYSDSWMSASDENKKKALAMAGYIIDAAFSWKNNAYYVTEEGQIIWHDHIYASVCEQAIYMLTNNIYEYPEILTKGFKEAEGGTDISITLDKDFIFPFLSKTAIGMIGNLGSLNDPAGQGTMDIFDVIRGI